MSLASETRDAVRARPFLYDALRAGVVNYTAAARTLDVDGEVDAVATALRRFAEELPEYSPPAGEARVSMETGLGPVDAETTDPLLVVGDARFGRDAGSLTAVVATGDLSGAALADVLGRSGTADVDVEAAAVGGETLVVVVERRDGPDTLRLVEAAVGR
ncbi:hypothetical protein ACFQGE_13585 [Halomicroarcula sp. GCM10025817]|uniref:DUF7523 family protein n=1 Tax=Haloarcula TaxID=2237 RepID=UPI0023E79A08|nr:hypothetical protein [Halomicroarcula sp. SYNS111]